MAPVAVVLAVPEAVARYAVAKPRVEQRLAGQPGHTSSLEKRNGGRD